MTSALAGTRVVELGGYAAGPVVGKYLANYGADVIRIESRRRDWCGRRDRGRDRERGRRRASAHRISVEQPPRGLSQSEGGAESERYDRDFHGMP